MGIQDRTLVFGGAGPGTPWGTLGLVVGRALAPHGFTVRVEPEASRDNGFPLHPGAARYYREMGYPIGAPVP